jgi:hypothetical protein
MQLLDKGNVRCRLNLSQLTVPHGGRGCSLSLRRAGSLLLLGGVAGMNTQASRKLYRLEAADSITDVGAGPYKMTVRTYDWGSPQHTLLRSVHSVKNVFHGCCNS